MIFVNLSRHGADHPSQWIFSTGVLHRLFLGGGLGSARSAH